MAPLPTINSTNIDSEIVALSAKDVLKLFAKDSDTEVVSARALPTAAVELSDIEKESASASTKSIAKANDSDILTTLFLFRPVEVLRSSDALAESSSA